MNNTITAVPNLIVGHYTDLERATGCTVILTPQGARAGVDVRGFAPGTRETDALRPEKLVQEVHGILITGGSAFGLAAADGVMRWLADHGYGFDTGFGRVPIVPAAVLFDLMIGDSRAYPDARAGYQACEAATDEPVPMGNVGAGTGATVGKILGPRYAMKGGLGSASVKIARGITVGALVAVNALGDVVDPRTGEIVAGARKPVVGGFLNTAHVLKGQLGQTILNIVGGNTTLAVVATDAALTKTQLTALASMAHDGLARAIRPVHTMLDGDTVFALSTGDRRGDLTAIGAAAVEVLAEAVIRAVQSATSLHGFPAVT